MVSGLFSTQQICKLLENSPGASSAFVPMVFYSLPMFILHIWYVIRHCEDYKAIHYGIFVSLEFSFWLIRQGLQTWNSLVKVSTKALIASTAQFSVQVLNLLVHYYWLIDWLILISWLRRQQQGKVQVIGLQIAKCV